ncbi:Gfo/Idh/MocA family protein [Aureimonas frigidaquae]|uniref:Gfo/Idh/MocA family oxidoreductase n=1 Tax=Aureimonas frigidaquae TaxID=424757 RepID=A0A0P0Z2R3_9HYPH|nr:Gfo/Idh/MocA family oxidoreductase [Aureimonas frigidaquae]BAT28160.1 Gfo/Idh/MocA family oxidoreductase [Aureimonas frigidaquae]
MDDIAPIRLGMIGGGSGAFIGAVHRIAARLDGHYTLVAGALSSTPDKARESGLALGLSPERSYDDFRKMAVAEARRPDGIEVVAICTPNHMHLPVAEKFLKRGIHVICDKPLTGTLADARRMCAAVGRGTALFVLTHNYSGYPLIRQARAMVADGALGALRVVQVEYAQDWLTESVETQGSKQAEWRTDPERAGLGGALGDIGTHAFHLSRYVSGLTVESLAADLSSFGAGRTLDDNAHVLLRYDGGAKGMLWCSQVAPGHENDLRLRLFGDKGGLEWRQEQPNVLRFTPYGEPTRLITRNGAGSDAACAAAARVPAGHPEGYLEAFANIYSDAAAMIRAARSGPEAMEASGILPGVADGVEGVSFVDACVRSSRANGRFVTLRS